MTKYLRSHWEEEDIAFLWEIDDDGWVTRSIELVGPERRVVAAAVLSDVLSARDHGGIKAVQDYETRYGVVPEKAIDDWTFPHEVISQSVFELAWAEARATLEP